MNRTYVFVLASLLAGMPAVAADVSEADARIQAVREKIAERSAVPTTDRTARALRKAETSLRKAENRRRAGDPDAALEHVHAAEARLAKAEAEGVKK